MAHIFPLLPSRHPLDTGQDCRDLITSSTSSSLWMRQSHLSGVLCFTALRALLFEERITRSQEILGTWWHWDQDLREEVGTQLVYGGKGWRHDSTMLFTTRHRQVCCPLITTNTPLHCSYLSPPQNRSNGQSGKQCPLTVDGDTKIDLEYTFKILFQCLLQKWCE